MCTYDTYRCELTGSGKGRAGWLRLSEATVYYDHPVHAFAEHTLNVDLTAADRDPAGRIAVELPAESALRLLKAMAASLISAPPEISGLAADDVAALRALGAPSAAAGGESMQKEKAPHEGGAFSE